PSPPPTTPPPPHLLLLPPRPPARQPAPNHQIIMLHADRPISLPAPRPNQSLHPRQSPRQVLHSGDTSRQPQLPPLQHHPQPRNHVPLRQIPHPPPMALPIAPLQNNRRDPPPKPPPPQQSHPRPPP